MVQENLGNSNFDRHVETSDKLHVPLARAIAVRNLEEQQRDQKRIAELTSSDYKPMNPIIREALILTATRLNCQLIDNPSTSPSTSETLLDTVFNELGDEPFDEIVREMQKEETESLPISGSQLRTLSRATANSALSSFVPSSITAKGFIPRIRQIDEARKIGTERSIDPVAIYANDELYAELVRRSETPNEVAKTGIQMLRQATSNRMREFFINMIPSMALTIDELDGLTDNERLIKEDEIEEMKREINEDPEFKKMVKKENLKYRKLLRIVTIERIVRFWGQEGLDSLPKSAKAALDKTLTVIN